MWKILAMVLFSCLLGGQAMSQVSQSIYRTNSGSRQNFHGEVPEAVKQYGLQPLNRLESSKQLTLVIGLPLRNSERGFPSAKQKSFDISPKVTLETCS